MDFNLLSKMSWSQHSVYAVLIVCAMLTITTQEKNKKTVLVARVDGTEHNKGLTRADRNEYQKLHEEHSFTTQLPKQEIDQSSAQTYTKSLKQLLLISTENREMCFMHRIGSVAL